MKIDIRRNSEGSHLIIDGEHHSLVRWTDPRTDGHSWDGMACIYHLLDERKFVNVLLLGLGGGTVFRIMKWLDAYRNPGRLVPTAVEISREVYTECVDCLGLDEVIMPQDVFIESAASYLKSHLRKEDLVIDDTWHGGSKPKGCGDWVPLAMDRVATHGYYVANMVRTDVWWYQPMLRRHFSNVVSMRIEGLSNVILIGSDAPLNAWDVRNAMILHFPDLRRRAALRTVQQDRR